ncbi:hypothetical protein PNOK_0726400 [Pyrrhoderma noxium]|uniref:Uncharacterized protein n=1 Tax=Pyrrhoderma noxium TaxID=2282107 RepID=A0A286UC90_9AGAM|nr:hypothetical protein PNOK_0726400 [Pyrrhoderma noxium]
MLTLCEATIKLMSYIKIDAMANIAVLYGNTTICTAKFGGDGANIKFALSDCFHNLDSGSYLLNVILTGIGSPILFSLLGSRMAINLKEAGESETKGEITNHWELHPRSTLSEPQFAAPAVTTMGKGKHTVELQPGVSASQSIVW